MSSTIIEKWNARNSKIPNNKSESNYAIEKEKSFPRNSNVLDLGSGPGADAIYFTKKGHKVTIADISDKALSMGKERAEKESVIVTTVQYSIGKDPFPFGAETFDVVYSRLSLHYFNPEETMLIFRNVYDALKQGGSAFLTLKSPNDKEEMSFLRNNALEIYPNVFEESGDIKSRYTIDQLNEILVRTGITNATVKEYTEDLSGRIDAIKSGNDKFLLNEIIIKKL